MYPPMMFWQAIPNLRKISNNCDLPPTVYALLNSYVNFGNDNPVKIANLAKAGRSCIFDFEYPLATGWSKEEFETMVLNHFLMRRIGYETVTAFKIALNVKLNEVMPNYNILYDSIKSWNVFNDGETVTRNNTSTLASNEIGSATTSGTSDQRSSDTPQNAISDVQSGTYVSNYEYDQTSDSTDTSTSKSDISTDAETITRSPADKINIYQKFLASKQNLYTMIFKDLDSLFYQILS